MRIRIQDIAESQKSLGFEEPTTELNPLLDQGPVQDYRFVRSASVTVSHYRAGQDLFLEGRASTDVVGQCARCLESYSFELEAPFSFVLIPRPAAVPEQDEDADLSFYEGEEIDLSPLLRERILLALPTQPLCRHDCRGLCASCGTNLNLSSCECHLDRGDPRLAILRTLKVKS